MKKQTKLGLVLAAAALISVSVASLVSARGWVQQGADWYYVDNDGEYVTETIQTSGNTKFYLGEDGTMQKDYFLEDYNNNTYYFGSNGAMVTNTWVAIESDRTDNQGDYVPDNYWYYFQASGKAVKGTSDNPKKSTIDGKKYMFNEYGQMCTGWVDENGNVIDPDTDDDGGPFVNACYYAGGDNDGVLRTGWVTYYDGWNGSGFDYQTEKTNIYFYFNTTNNKKYGFDGATTKKINGKTYAFDQNGMMLAGWDVVDNDGIITSLSDKTVYFSGEDDGHQVKKGWVYAVPAESIDQSAYDDGEEKYFYFGSSGDATVDTFKKINGKYYVFNTAGIMKTGVVVWCPTKTNAQNQNADSHFVKTLDLDWAEGSEVAKKGLLRYDKGEGDYIVVTRTGLVIDDNKKFGETEYDYTEEQPASQISDALVQTNADLNTFKAHKIRLHLFGDDGARKTGTNTINFADDAYTFTSNASGNKDSGLSNKKYYSLGIQLKASADIKYGIYVATDNQGWYQPQANVYKNHLYDSGEAVENTYYVLNTAGSKQKAGAKKDADGNYWVMGYNGALKGIFSVEVKTNKTKSWTVKLPNVEVSESDLSNWRTDETQPSGNFAILSSIEDGSTTLLMNSMQDSFATTSIALLDVIGTNGYADNFLTDNTITLTFKTEELVEIDSINTVPTATLKITGDQFKSEFNTKANTMIYFGVYDDAVKTAKYAYAGNSADEFFQVTPNNDYFLNCYWAD